MVLLYAVETTIPPPLMTKKEKEEFQTNRNTDTKMQQKDADLLKIVQTVAESLQQQIVLGMCTADMSQQCTETLIGELIKSHYRYPIGILITFSITYPPSMDWSLKSV